MHLNHRLGHLYSGFLKTLNLWMNPLCFWSALLPPQCDVSASSEADPWPYTTTQNVTTWTSWRIPQQWTLFQTPPSSCVALGDSWCPRVALQAYRRVLVMELINNYKYVCISFLQPLPFGWLAVCVLYLGNKEEKILRKGKENEGPLY